jgi:hypothetical protein
MSFKKRMDLLWAFEMWHYFCHMQKMENVDSKNMS